MKKIFTKIHVLAICASTILPTTAPAHDIDNKLLNSRQWNYPNVVFYVMDTFTRQQLKIATSRTMLYQFYKKNNPTGSATEFNKWLTHLRTEPREINLRDYWLTEADNTSSIASDEEIEKMIIENLVAVNVLKPPKHAIDTCEVLNNEFSRGEYGNVLFWDSKHQHMTNEEYDEILNALSLNQFLVTFSDVARNAIVEIDSITCSKCKICPIFLSP